MKINKEFWRGKRVLLTGHTGFKGSWLTLWLSEMGAHVKGYALPPPTDPSLFDLLQLSKNCDHIEGDIRDQKRFTESVRAATPDIVFHMAAQPLVLESYNDPVGTYATNVMGTVHLLEACRSVPSVKAIINITTDKVYENFESEDGYKESDRLGGYDPYSNSKACAELATSAYRNSFYKTLPILTVRAGNVIGGGDWADNRLIPDAARAFTKGESVEVRNPDAVRPWQHVLEPLNGYLLLAERAYGRAPQPPYSWNFGPEDESMIPVGEVLELFSKAWGEGTGWKDLSGREVKKKETKILKLDCSQAKELLGFAPKLKLAQALAMTANWYKEYRDNPKNLVAFTKKQIADYVGL